MINTEKWAHEIPADTIAIEVSGREKDVQRNFDKGDFNCWTPERIKGAFNWGRGTIQHLKKYAENNKAYCTIVFI